MTTYSKTPLIERYICLSLKVTQKSTLNVEVTLILTIAASFSFSILSISSLVSLLTANQKACCPIFARSSVHCSFLLRFSSSMCLRFSSNCIFNTANRGAKNPLGVFESSKRNFEVKYNTHATDYYNRDT